MLHTESVHCRGESTVAHVGSGEVHIRHDGQATDGSIDESGEIEARNHPVTTLLEYNLRTLEAQLEVSGQHLLNSLRMTEYVSRFGTGFREEAVEPDGGVGT